MTKLVFIEGVSGVGKSTMVHMLADELRTLGYTVREYAEFDYTNPIDFYCTAYLSLAEYEGLCTKYKFALETLCANTIEAGDVRLVRYYDEDTPLFEEPLLSELVRKEFCYNPVELVTMDEYTAAYVNVWNNFVLGLDETYDFMIFDGSLLHHPINDMMRNYKIMGEQAIFHVKALLHALGERERCIFYLKTGDIGTQLQRAHADRGQKTPTKGQVAFWEKRYVNDMLVLNHLQEDCQIYDVTEDGWDSARKQILRRLEVVER